MKDNLEELALTLQGVINTAIDGIITIDQKGVVESINKSAANQFGYKAHEVIGNNIKMLMPEPYHSEHDGYVERYNRTQKPRIIGIGREVVGKKKSGNLFPFRLAVSKVILNDRVIFTGIIHDLSEVKDAEKKLLVLNEELEGKVQERTEELEDVVNRLLESKKELEERENELNEALSKEKELNELKSRFVSMASHEFRTPLSTIMSSATLISRYVDEGQNDKRQKHVDRIKSAVNNLTGILNDFLSLSKIEEGKIITEVSKIDVPELCAEVIDEVKGLLKEGQEIEVEHDDVPKLHTDLRILKNILFNILSNAIKYTPVNGAIHCRLSFDGSFFQFQIKDSGIGIPEVDQKHLFDRFFRASNVENIQGTGLGLNIVKRYVDMLQGTIDFVSIENKGTTFTIRIPSIK